jgi:pimeloyl-ACP methyl ester carboxylesterase
MTLISDLEGFRRDFPERTITLQGLKWRLIEADPSRASTPALVLLPGTLGTGEVFWQQIRALAGRVRVLALSYPAVADVRRLADGVVVLMDRAGLDRAYVLGSSLGGYLAQTVALRHPGRIETIFVGNSLVDATPLRGLLGDPAQVAALPAAVLRAAMMASVAAWPEPEPVFAELKTVLRAQAARMSGRHLKARVRTLLTEGELAPLPLGSDRVVVIDSNDDPLIPPALRQQVRRRYAGAEIHSFERGGHFPYITRAAAYSTIMQKRMGVR